MMGADESGADAVNHRPELPTVGIGRGCNIEKTIIDNTPRFLNV
jgi:ADP-glucose pyrophosphorylase